LICFGTPNLLNPIVTHFGWKFGCNLSNWFNPWSSFNANLFL
jgi:hypothetical protein